MPFTLGDLEKAVRQGRTPEKEVGIIANKFPEMSGGPCVYHGTLGLGELLGHPVPMDGRVPRPGGRAVTVGGKRGVVYDKSPEAEAFSRWQRGEFLNIERGIAKSWRSTVENVDLRKLAQSVRDLGIDAKTCRSLEDARSLAEQIVTGRDKPFQRIALAIETLSVPREYQEKVVERWSVYGYPPLSEYSPYVAHVLRVELFFQFALAANLISTERPSHRVDIAYLYYLPFCMMFTSWDKLHRLCAPFFLREDQEFVWGDELKKDLARINTHFMGVPDDDKERGIMAFAHAPPNNPDSVVRRLRKRFLRTGVDDEKSVARPPRDNAANQALVKKMREWTKAKSLPGEAMPSKDETQTITIERKVHPKKGSWWQVPKKVAENERDRDDEED